MHATSRCGDVGYTAGHLRDLALTPFIAPEGHGPAIAPEWLREPVLVEIRLGPSLTMLTRAVAVGTCTALTAAALLAHLFCACLLQLVISRPWVTAVTAGYVIAWHSLSDTVWREPLPEGAEDEAA